MSDRTIYDALRAGGLSRVGVCAMMGNWQCESNLVSFRVQSDFSDDYIRSREYTAQVNCGNINEHEFIYDSPGGGGYGLAQWTFPSRKKNLYDATLGQGFTIDDEKRQCELAIWELQNDPQYAGLYQFLCVTENLAEATKRICAEYERPAVNNYAERINQAQRFFNLLAGSDTGSTEAAPPAEPTEEIAPIEVRVLHKGCLGRDVFMLQCGLFDMGFDCGMPDGDFGVNTEEAVKELQRKHDLEQAGVADGDVWQIVLAKR